MHSFFSVLPKVNLKNTSSGRGKGDEETFTKDCKSISLGFHVND
jgi:hypothetical protein